MSLQVPRTCVKLSWVVGDRKLAFLLLRIRGSGPGKTRTCGNEGGYVIETLRVSGSSRPNSVAGAVAALLRSEGEVEVQAIGPHAINQAVKAIAIARSYVEAEGIDLYTQPSFVKLELQNEERTAVRFTVTKIDLEPA